MQWEIFLFTILVIGISSFALNKYNKSQSGTGGETEDSQPRTSSSGGGGGGGRVRVLRRLPGRLAEYEVSGAPFSVPRWLALTACIAVLLFALGLHRQDDWVLAALLAALTLALLAKLHLKVKREILLVESSLGVQLTTVFSSGRRASLFLARGRLRDVVIAEALTMHRVVTYLALVRREPDGLVPLFRHTWPRREQLEPIYRDVQQILRPSGCEVRVDSS